MKKLKQLLALFAISAAALGIYAEETTPAPVPAPPVPTQSADDVLSITGYYGDAANLNMAQYSSGSSQKLTIDGKTVWALPTFDYMKLQFNELDLTKYTYLHLDIYAEEAMSGAMKYSVATGTHFNSISQSKVIQKAIGAEDKGKWLSFDWNIENDLKNGIDFSKIAFLVLGDTKREKSKTFYLGNVYAFGKKATEPEISTLGDFIADVNGKKYPYDGNGTTPTEIEAFIGDELNVNISIANAETLTATFNPEIEYNSADGKISFTATENCTVSLTASLGEEVKTAVYKFNFVEAPEINYPVYIGTVGYNSLAEAIATITNENKEVVITIAEDVESGTINVGGGSLTEYINLTIQGKTGSEKITFTTGTNTQSIKVNKGIINLKDIVLESKGQNYTCAIAYFPYVSSFNFENVTFKNFNTTASIIDFSPENKNATSNATGTLNNVWFDNCTVDNAANFNSFISIGRNGYLKVGDGNGPLTIYWPTICKAIEYVGTGIDWSNKAVIAFSGTPKMKNGTSEQPVVLNCAHPENFTIGGTLNPSFYTLTLNEASNNLYLGEKHEAEEVTINDEMDFVLTFDIAADKAVYTRTVNSGTWNALYLPFEVENASDFAESVVKFKSVEADGADGVVLVFEKVEAGSTLEPNQIYLFKPSTTEISAEGYDVTVHSTPAVDASESFELNDVTYTLTGTYKKMTGLMTMNAYALAGDGFKGASSDDVALMPYRAYLTITAAGSPAQNAPARIGIKTNDGQTTSIDNVAVESQINDGVYYNLQGVKVDNPTKGLYIVNGKKVIVK